MRILVDYRAALRARTGVGEYIHELVRAYSAASPGDDVILFSSSWKDRPDPALAGALGARVVDRRIPVSVLNLLWHRASWPPVESLAGDCDVAHAAHPLLLPTARAAQVVTIHDLFFLSHPERTHAEIRRDYPALAGELLDALGEQILRQHGARLGEQDGTLDLVGELAHVAPKLVAREQRQRLGRRPLDALLQLLRQPLADTDAEHICFEQEAA